MKSLKLVALSAVFTLGSMQLTAKSYLSVSDKMVSAAGGAIASYFSVLPGSKTPDEAMKVIWTAYALGLPLLAKEAIRSNKTELSERDQKDIESVDYYAYGWMAGTGSWMLMSKPEISSFIQQVTRKVAHVAQVAAKKAYNTTPAQAIAKIKQLAEVAVQAAADTQIGSTVKSHPYLAVGAAGAVVGAAAYKLYHAATVQESKELKQPEIYVDYYGQSVPTNCVPCAQ